MSHSPTGRPDWADSLPYATRRLFDPAVYQGGDATDDYFEGWYVKLVGSDGCSLALIPGVSRDASGGTSHSFVQVVRAGGRTVYVEYGEDEFVWSPDRFEVAVGPNRFTATGVEVDIAHPEVSVRGTVEFGELAPWPVTLAAPGIMGWYRYVPKMECYHGVVSMDHALTGTLELDGEPCDLTGGRGYIEKDWGSSFPSSWIWAQSNHYAAQPGASVTVSVAKIPWLGSSFVGFIAGVWVGGRLYRFTTYTGAKMTCFSSWEGGARVSFAQGRYELACELEGAVPAALKAPVHGTMVARADEALGATLKAFLRDRSTGEVLLDGVGEYAGVEVMDARGELGAGTPECAPR